MLRRNKSALQGEHDPEKALSPVSPPARSHISRLCRHFALRGRSQVGSQVGSQAGRQVKSAKSGVKSGAKSATNVGKPNQEPSRERLCANDKLKRHIDSKPTIVSL